MKCWNLIRRKTMNNQFFGCSGAGHASGFSRSCRGLFEMTQTSWLTPLKHFLSLLKPTKSNYSHVSRRSQIHSAPPIGDSYAGRDMCAMQWITFQMELFQSKTLYNIVLGLCTLHRQIQTDMAGVLFSPRWHCCLWNEADSKHFLFVPL